MESEPRVTLQVLAVLNAMLEAPRAEWYGLEIAKRASLRTGTVYPILARLERAGWLSSRWEEIDPAARGRPARRLYEFTGLGERSALSKLAESRSRLGDRTGSVRVPSPRLRPEGQPT